jgi:hypothetical protein
MLHREDAEGLIVISQPAHAWLSGQLARAWGNENFPAPSEETCMAAELHDIGFLQWEQLPTLNPATGLPHTFMDLPAQTHLDIWTAGIQQMMRFGRYAALLVSLHFAGLARKHMCDEPATAELTRKFLDAQGEIQTTLSTSLRNDYYYGPVSSDETFRCNQELVSLWDWMSLLLCMRTRQEKSLGSVSSAATSAELKLVPLDEDGARFGVGPWPFRGDSVKLVCEGRRLLKTYSEENVMRQDLRRAAPITVRIDLVRD